MIMDTEILTLLKCHSNEEEWAYFQFLVWNGYQYTREDNEVQITEYYKHIKDFSVCLN
jgi:hypothetical protein